VRVKSGKRGGKLTDSSQLARWHAGTRLLEQKIGARVPAHFDCDTRVTPNALHSSRKNRGPRASGRMDSSRRGGQEVVVDHPRSKDRSTGLGSSFTGMSDGARAMPRREQR
jgi:hypothetical protein